MNSSYILSIVTFIYAFAAVFYFICWIFKNKISGNLATWATIAGALGNVLGIALRWIESYQMGYGHAPLSNLYESLIFFSLSLAVIYLFVEYKYKIKTIGAFAMTTAFLFIAYASLSPNVRDTIQPILPALKSNWLIGHVMTCFLGYSALAISFGISLMYLLKQIDISSKNRILASIPDVKILDQLTHQMVAFGFLFLSIGIITGAVWANSAWGRYWGWDPKETWSLITWFFYATLLHARLVRGWQGKRIASLSVIGFLAVLFTYFGVNYLPGLHSYGASG